MLHGHFRGRTMTGHTTATPIEIEQLETHVQSQLSGRVQNFRLVVVSAASS